MLCIVVSGLSGPRGLLLPEDCSRVGLWALKFKGAVQAVQWAGLRGAVTFLEEV